ncbi:unnamed protein product [Brassica rapa]|uniref:Uncharacterized protein n=1 Tax=Brassica campestris TaxID=3711 RepID=A0A8D9CPH6_BRACM|nr:unnamed protein product [Brassica rapa]
MWAHTLSQRQEFRQSSIQFSMRLSFPTTYNEKMVQAMKETATTTATTSCRLFGVDLMVPAITKDPVEPIDSYKKKLRFLKSLKTKGLTMSKLKVVLRLCCFIRKVS